MEFHYVELRCLAQASEDPERVRRALAFALGLTGLPPEAQERGCGEGPPGSEEHGGSEGPPEAQERGCVEGPPDGRGAYPPAGAWREVLKEAGATEERLRGQYGNPIVIMTARLRKKGALDRFWERFKVGAPPDLMARLRDGVEERVDDELVFHFRLDKQAAYLGRLALGRGGDTIAVRCKPKVFGGGRAGAVGLLEEFLGENAPRASFPSKKV